MDEDATNYKQRSRAVFLYHGCQVSEVCNITATYGVEDSDVRAIIAEE